MTSTPAPLYSQWNPQCDVRETETKADFPRRPYVARNDTNLSGRLNPAVVPTLIHGEHSEPCPLYRPDEIEYLVRMADVTLILQAIDQGDPQATDKLLPIVYDELRKLAAHKLSHERPGQTLQATALVHEAYLRLVDTPSPTWESRRHFFGAAAEAMRRILVDRARRKKVGRNSGQERPVEIDRLEMHVDVDASEVIALDDALDALREVDPEGAEVVSLRYFAGLSLDDAASAMNLSPSTVQRRWRFARAWLLRTMNAD